MTDNLSHTGKYTNQVQGVVALLDEQHTAKVKEIWSLLQVECGLSAINSTPFPHFSFHIAEYYDLEILDTRLEKISRTTPPFTIRTTGLSIFTGLEPVVFVPLIVEEQLLKIHQTLWEQTSTLGYRLSSHYRPGAWVPHITLANRDVDANNIACVARHLVNRSFSWEIPINKLAVVCQENGVAEIGTVYLLQGKT